MRAPLLGLAILAACNDYQLDNKDDPADTPQDTAVTEPTDPTDTEPPPEDCPGAEQDAVEVGVSDVCVPKAGSFTPIVEWDYGSGGELSYATVAVGDLNGDGMPDIAANVAGFFGNGDLVLLNGDGTVIREIPEEFAYGSSPAIGDLDGDGVIEIIIVHEYASSFLQTGSYSLVCYHVDGTKVWESDKFVGDDFDYATAPAISDMDHDGFAEVVAGRVILNFDGTTRGVGAYGRGSYGQVALGGVTIDESSVSAVVDLDLDGVEEVVVGNAVYDPDGNAIWYDPSQDDGMIAIANLDADPEGEIIASTYDTVRAMDTDGTLLWGPIALPGANIVSPAAIEDIDLDGMPEIVVAGGNQLRAINHDGTTLWTAPVTDMSGASGASMFDFEGDGQPEVVYIDEVEMVAYDGLTGAVKFYNTDHGSVTMMDYPVIADVDGDDHAEILVAHSAFTTAFSVYGDLDDTWAPARKVWNQHGYSIENVNDDLSIPVTATPGFTTHNSWHSAYGREVGEVLPDLMGEIVDVCDLTCDRGLVDVTFRLLNLSADPFYPGVPLALYARVGGVEELLAVVLTSEVVDGGWSTPTWTISVDAALLTDAEAVVLRVDDNGSGVGSHVECVETNNDFEWAGPFCQG